MPTPAAASGARFLRERRIVFGIVLASFVLSFFHRNAPAAIAGELTRAFAINSVALGTMHTPVSDAVWSDPDSPQAKAILRRYAVRRLTGDAPPPTGRPSGSAAPAL